MNSAYAARIIARISADWLWLRFKLRMYGMQGACGIEMGGSNSIQSQISLR
jgi:hypothetical protein